MSGPSRPGQFRRIGPVIITALIFLTAAAFVYSQRLKREPLVVDRVDLVVLGTDPDLRRSNLFTPNGDCRNDRMGIYFRTTKSDRMDVAIVDSEGSAVTTLASNRFFKRYREHVLIWDGRNRQGRFAPTGRYRVRVTMRGLDRVLELPGTIRLRNIQPRESACPGAPDPGAKAASR